MNREDEEWGVPLLTRALISSRHQNARQLCANIQERVLRFTGDAPQYDDMTLLAMRVNPEASV